jgi:hypothetical protein
LPQTHNWRWFQACVGVQEQAQLLAGFAGIYFFRHSNPKAGLIRISAFRRLLSECGYRSLISTLANRIWIVAVNWCDFSYLSKQAATTKTAGSLRRASLAQDSFSMALAIAPVRSE